jgi:hypothetical protein
MLNKILLILLAVFSQTLFAKQIIITSDITPQDVTHCGIYIDSKFKTEISVDLEKRCNIDLPQIFPQGVHSIKATYINYDANNIRTESKDFSNIILVYRVNLSNTTWWFSGDQIICVLGMCEKTIPK